MKYPILVSTSVYISEELARRLRMLGAERNLSRSRYLRDMLESPILLAAFIVACFTDEQRDTLTAELVRLEEQGGKPNDT